MMRLFAIYYGYDAVLVFFFFLINFSSLSFFTLLLSLRYIHLFVLLRRTISISSIRTRVVITREFFPIWYHPTLSFSLFLSRISNLYSREINWIFYTVWICNIYTYTCIYKVSGRKMFASIIIRSNDFVRNIPRQVNFIFEGGKGHCH